MLKSNQLNEGFIIDLIFKDFYGKAHTISAAHASDRAAVYGVYIDSQEVLLIKDSWSKRWELPGGGVEKGETDRQALVREFKEESGVEPTGKVKLFKQWTENFFDVVSNQAWHSKRKFYVVSDIKTGATLLENGNNEDSTAAKMWPINDIVNLNMQPEIKDLIRLIVANKLG